MTKYEFVKVNNHKSHLLMNCTCTFLEKLSAAIEDPIDKEWDKRNNCKDTIYAIKSID